MFAIKIFPIDTCRDISKLLGVPITFPVELCGSEYYETEDAVYAAAGYGVGGFIVAVQRGDFSEFYTVPPCFVEDIGR